MRCNVMYLKRSNESELGKPPLILLMHAMVADELVILRFFLWIICHKLLKCKHLIGCCLFFPTGAPGTRWTKGRERHARTCRIQGE